MMLQLLFETYTLISEGNTVLLILMTDISTMAE